MSDFKEPNNPPQSVMFKNVKNPGREVKCILVSSDGVNFLMRKEYYTMVLSTGDLISEKTLQGRKFILEQTEKEKEFSKHEEHEK